MSDVPEPVTDSTPVVVILSRPFVPQWLATALSEVGPDRLRAIVVLASRQRSKPALAHLARLALEQRSREGEKARHPIALEQVFGEVLVVESVKEVETALRGHDVVVDLTETRTVPPLKQRLVLTLSHGTSPATAPDALLRELLRQDTTVTASVVAEYAGERWEVASVRTAASRWSLRETRERLAGKTATLLPRALHAVGRADPSHPVPPRALSDLSNLGVAVAAARLVGAAARALLASLTTTADYGVAWSTRNASDSPLQMPQEVNWVENRDEHFFADPFLARSDGRTFVFVEDFSRRQGYATIGVFDVRDPQGTFRTVLDRGTHLSYPFVFRDIAEDAWLMLPEMAAERRITLFRAEVFPEEWREDAVLVDDIAAFDPTLLHRDGRYWLFYASGTPSSTGDDELHLASSESLRGPYVPHPGNPLRADAIGARPAGRLFEWNGRLIRPGQDSSREYGYAVVFYEVTSLTTSSYAEVEIGRLPPSWAPRIRGTHSWDFLDDIIVTDAKRVSASRGLIRVGVRARMRLTKRIGRGERRP
jgi:hypothetical protein